jgi:hypothetical protein
VQRSRESSAASKNYAFYSDVASNSLAFVGIGVGIQASDVLLKTAEYGFPSPIVLGVLAALASAIVPFLAKRLEIYDGKRSPEFDGVVGFDGDDIVLLVPIMLSIGWGEGLLVVAAAGGIAFAGGLYMAHFRKFHSLI